MRVGLWLEYGFYGYHTVDASQDSSMGPLLDRHPEYLSVDSSGARFLHNRSWGDYYLLCPSNPAVHEVIAQIAAEAAGRYDCDEVNLDRIRYGGDNYCYCPYCRRQFLEDTGLKLDVFDRGSTQSQAFLHWKRAQLVKAVSRITSTVRAARPGVTMTAYVVSPFEMDAKAQSWDLWIRHGHVDAVAVSMYGADIRSSCEAALRLLDDRGSAMVCAVSCEQAGPVYLSNIGLSRRYSALGQATWFAGAVEDDVPGLLSGPYAQPAISPFAANGTSTCTHADDTSTAPSSVSTTMPQPVQPQPH
jgi:hypothetical protein